MRYRQSMTLNKTGEASKTSSDEVEKVFPSSWLVGDDQPVSSTSAYKTGHMRQVIFVYRRYIFLSLRSYWYSNQLSDC